MAARPERIAIFDLDGTLTRRDTFVPYVLAFVARRPARWPGLLRVMALVVRFMLGRIDRDRFKEGVVIACLGGAQRDEITVSTARFVERLVAGGLWPKAIAALEEHRAAGDRLILLSASPDFYVPALAAKLAFHECICTEVRWEGARLSGRFATANRRGEEKARVVRGLREGRRGPMVAYANSSSDLEHLALLEHPVLVNGSASVRRRAAELGIECRDWR